MNANPPALRNLQQQCIEYFHDAISETTLSNGALTLEIRPEYLKPTCEQLRDQTLFAFDMLLDVSGVDYLHYGRCEWQGATATASGFDRGADRQMGQQVIDWQKPRFASVYHLLSTQHNWRIRLRTFVSESTMTIDSVTDIWPAANWYEREAFDLFGIIYDGHPDLRRILTDYGFIGHPLRKDFPLSGHVEVRYDAKSERVIYEPVDIEPRINVPKVIRQDHRYLQPTALKEENDDGGN